MRVCESCCDRERWSRPFPGELRPYDTCEKCKATGVVCVEVNEAEAVAHQEKARKLFEEMVRVRSGNLWAIVHVPRDLTCGDIVEALTMYAERYPFAAPRICRGGDGHVLVMTLF
jgi:hypothetical protein